MLISPLELKLFWQIRPKTILHVGAHNAEEYKIYKKNNWGQKKTVWVEALPHVAKELMERFKYDYSQVVINALAYSTTGQNLRFFVSSNEQSSSIYKFKDHKDVFPEIKTTYEIEISSQKLDDHDVIKNEEKFELIVLDIQGSELEALIGLQSTLTNSQAVYCEFSTIELYDGAVCLADLNDWLEVQGLVMVDYRLFSKSGWGEGLWIRSHFVPKFPFLRARLRKTIRNIGEFVSLKYVRKNLRK